MDVSSQANGRRRELRMAIVHMAVAGGGGPGAMPELLAGAINTGRPGRISKIRARPSLTRPSPHHVQGLAETDGVPAVRAPVEAQRGRLMQAGAGRR